MINKQKNFNVVIYWDDIGILGRKVSVISHKGNNQL